MKSVYEHAGGDEAPHRLEIFYAKALADPVLKSLFTERRPHHIDHLTWFTAGSFGGPDRFRPGDLTLGDVLASSCCLDS